MPKGNPNPVQSEAFKRHTFVPKSEVYSDKKLAGKPTMVRLAEDITNAIDGLGEAKTPWLRRVISMAAYSELLKKQPPGSILVLNETEAIAVLPVAQAEIVQTEIKPIKSVAEFEFELIAIALKHSGRAKLPKAWLDFIEKIPVGSDLPPKSELEAIAKKCIKKAVLTEAWQSFIDQISQ
jgi:ribonucleotide monophosphatase NagD (HAD superfamily)